jgi:hypothetical protein
MKTSFQGSAIYLKVIGLLILIVIPLGRSSKRKNHTPFGFFNFHPH